MMPSWLALGGHFLRARWYFTRLQGPALRAYQERRARAIVRYAIRHSPFYRDHFAGHDPREWQTLPTTDKQLMMAHFGRFNTRGVSLQAALGVALRAETSRDFRPTVRGLAVGLSSGTSGHRGLFLVSPEEQAAWVGTILARALPGFRRQGYRVALFLRSNSNLYERVGSRHIRFRYFDLMMPPAEAVAALQEYRPDVLVGPPSLLCLLAAARTAGTLAVAPSKLISVAEVLEPHDQERLAASFGVPVHQIYQCTEGLLAVSCPQAALHLQEDIVALQFERLAEGEESPRVMPIVTDLWRRTQPIIRYRLNDVLTLDPRPCKCGSAFRVLARVEGRCDDVCYFEQAGGGLRLVFPDAIRRMILLSSADIRDYQAFQVRCGQLRIHLDTASAVDFDRAARAVRVQVAAALEQYGCRPASVSVECGLVPQSADRKRRRVQRLG
jgi:phenylacetate-CoA ligase